MSTESDFMGMIMEFMNDDPVILQYVKSQAPVYDVTTSTNTTTKVSYPTNGILLDFTHTNNGLSSKFGTEIVAGDKELYMLPPNKYDPMQLPIVIDTTQDQVVIGNLTYKCMVMKEVNPTGSNPILYNFLLRR